MVPDHSWPDGGNAITAQRVATEVQRLGLHASVYPLRQMRLGLETQPAVLHAFHALKSGLDAVRVARSLELPLVVTCSGTDLTEDLADPERARSVLQVLAQATVITVFHPGMRASLAAAAPEVTSKVRLIAPGMAAPAGSRAPQDFGLDPRAFNVLLPAGLRPVKRPLFALEAIQQLRDAGQDIRLTVAGSPLEAATTQAVHEAAYTHSWVRYLGVVAHERMGDLYRSVDVVLNSSRAEGLANAVLEAMAVGRPLLLSDIEGNRAAAGDDALYFQDSAGLRAALERLARQPELRQALGQRAQSRAAAHFSPEAEALAYAKLYRQLSKRAS